MFKNKYLLHILNRRFSIKRIWGRITLGGKKRMRKCIYCNQAISDDSVIDFCTSCGIGVWGEKMFNTILQNMEDARANGTLCNSNL